MQSLDAGLEAFAEAPLSFLIGFALGAMAAWVFAKLHFRGRVDTTLAQRDLAQDQVKDYKEKLRGATPEEAEAKIADLQLQIHALAPRKVTAEQASRLEQQLRKTGWQKARIVWHGDSGEPEQYARDLARCFEKAGIEVACDTLGPFLASAWGTIVVRNQYQNGEKLLAILTEADIDARILDSNDAFEKVEWPLIVVGNKE